MILLHPMVNCNSSHAKFEELISQKIRGSSSQDYLFELTASEWSCLKSKFSTSNRDGKVKLPNAFTEKALYMIATTFKSPQSVQTTLSIIETIAKMRGLSPNLKELSNTLPFRDLTCQNYLHIHFQNKLRMAPVEIHLVDPKLLLCKT